MRTKIDRNKNWMIQSIFGKVGLNICVRREEKKKNITRAQPHLWCIYEPYQHEENDVLLQLPLWIIDFDNQVLPAPPKKNENRHALTRITFLKIIFKILKLLKEKKKPLSNSYIVI